MKKIGMIIIALLFTAGIALNAQRNEGRLPHDARNGYLSTGDNRYAGEKQTGRQACEGHSPTG